MMAPAKAAKRKAKSRKPAKGVSAAPSRGFGQQRPPAMPSVELNTGARIPLLGFGTYKTGGDGLQVALRHAIAAGYRHIDTAACYENEEVVAAAIAESKIPRDEFFLTTKLWCTDHGTERTRRAIESSLERLGTEYIDLYLVHGPWGLDVEKSPQEISELRRQSWLVMEEYHRAGALRAIGVSNFEPRHVDDILDAGTVTPAINQCECHAYLPQTELRHYCASRGILFSAYGSAGANGLLQDDLVREIAARHARTPAQISLRYAVQRGLVALTKSLSERRIRKNGLIFDFELSDEEMGMLDGLGCGQRSYWDNSDAP